MLTNKAIPFYSEFYSTTQQDWTDLTFFLKLFLQLASVTAYSIGFPPTTLATLKSSWMTSLPLPGSEAPGPLPFSVSPLFYLSQFRPLLLNTSLS